MQVFDLFESSPRQLVVIYPGRFQPFHKGHAEVFHELQSRFGSDNVYIVTSNKTDGLKSPFNFSDKVKFMNAGGIPAHSIIENTGQMYDLPPQFNKQNTVFIAAVGSPDAKRLNPGGVKKDGTPSYFQSFDGDLKGCESADQHGYVVVVNEKPETIAVGGKQYDVSHGTQTRELWNAIRKDPKQRKEFITGMYGKYHAELEPILDKIAESINEDAAGVGVVKNGKDPRYVMATAGDQNDVDASTLPQMMKNYNLIPGKKKTLENAESLHRGDPVIITGKGIEFEGKTGEIADFGMDNRFVIVNLYNHGKHSFHSSDVSYNDHDSEEEELDEVNPHNFDSDVDYYSALKGKPKRDADDYEIPDPVPSEEDDYYARQARKPAPAKPEVKTLDKEGEAPNGEKYNTLVRISAQTPAAAEHALNSYKDYNWGAKKVVAVERESGTTITAYVVDNHKHGYWKAWKEATVDNPEDLDEGWKDWAVGGAMAIGALGAGHAHAGGHDLSRFATDYLVKVAQGDGGRAMVSIDDAKAELQARASGKQQGASQAETPRQQSASQGDPKGLSKEYLQKAADPDRVGRYLISVKKAQELLGQMMEAGSAAQQAAIAINMKKHHKKPKDVDEGKKQDSYHIVNKDGKPASLASYADKASAVKDRDAKHPGAEVRQVGPRGKVKGVAEGMKAHELSQYCEELVAEKGWDAAYKHALMMANIGRDPAWNGVLKYLNAMKQGMAEGFNFDDKKGRWEWDDGTSYDVSQLTPAQKERVAKWKAANPGKRQGRPMSDTRGENTPHGSGAGPSVMEQGVAEAVWDRHSQSHIPRDGRTFGQTNHPREEHCDSCGAPTGHAGPGEDSNVDDNGNVYCDDCYADEQGVAEGATGAKPGWMLKQDPALAKKVKDSKHGHEELKKWAGKPVPKDDKQVDEGSELKQAKRKYNQAAKDANADQVGAGKKIDTMKNSLRQRDLNKQGMAEGEQQKGADYRKPKEAEYGPEYDDMVARVKKLAGLGPMKTVYDPDRRVYRNVPTAVQPPKK
jgi:hypothetical protein